MSVQMKFFNIPIAHQEEAGEKLNAFLKTIRVIDLERHFVESGSRSFRSVFVA